MDGARKSLVVVIAAASQRNATAGVPVAVRAGALDAGTSDGDAVAYAGAERAVEGDLWVAVCQLSSWQYGGLWEVFTAPGAAMASVAVRAATRMESFMVKIGEGW